MRLIDADALRKKLLEIIRIYEKGGRGERTAGFYNAVDAVINSPTIEAEPQWIPVTERLPENDTTVLVHRPTMTKKIMTSYYFNGFHDGVWDMYGNEVITHWMPLPKPPEMDGGADHD